MNDLSASSSATSAAAPAAPRLEEALRDAMAPDLAAGAHAERTLRLAAALTGATGAALASAGPPTSEPTPRFGPADAALDALAVAALEGESGEGRRRDRLAKRFGSGDEAFALAIRVTGGDGALSLAWERLAVLAEMSALRGRAGRAGLSLAGLGHVARLAHGDWDAAQEAANVLRRAMGAGAVALGAVEDGAVARHVVSEQPGLAASGAAGDAIRDRLSTLARGEPDAEGARFGSAVLGTAIVALDAPADMRRDGFASLAGVFALSGRRPRRLSRLRRHRGPLIAAATLIAVGLAPVPDAVETPTLATSDLVRIVTAPEAAVLLEMEVEEGDVVAAGDVIARFDARDAELALSEMRAQLAATLAALQDARGRRDAAARRDAELEIEQIRARIDRQQARRDAATLTAPIDGVILRDHGRDRVGAVSPAGDPVAEIVSPDRPLLEAWVRSRDRARIATGDEGRFRADADPGRETVAVVREIAAAAEERDGFTVFRVALAPAADAPRYAVGMRGVTAFDSRRRAVAAILWSRLYAWARRGFWI